ncbi:MAG: hypothetical protein AVDCRST_MAG39-170, partial [uncultured Sphingomonadaceae bacterium]
GAYDVRRIQGRRARPLGDGLVGPVPRPLPGERGAGGDARLRRRRAARSAYSRVRLGARDRPGRGRAGPRHRRARLHDAVRGGGARARRDGGRAVDAAWGRGNAVYSAGRRHPRAGPRPEPAGDDL